MAIMFDSQKFYRNIAILKLAMGLTKTEAFSEDQNELASLAKALAHPARIAILQHLLKINACICGDLVEVLPLSQPTVSQHLKALKSVGLIKGCIEGTSVSYCIDAARWKLVRERFGTFFDTLVAEQDCSC